MNEYDTQATPDVSGDITRWKKRLKAAQEHDKAAREQYAKDRRQARGDSALEVTANILGTFIDVLSAFLAARQPDVDVVPARSIEPPSLDALRDAASDVVRQQPEIQMATAAVQTAAEGMGAPDAMQIAQQVAEAKTEEEVVLMFEQMRKKFSRRQRDAKVFSETLELVIGQLWEQANMKRRINAAVRSALTISVGWKKASWQKTTGMDDAMTAQRLNTLKDNIAKVKAEMDAAEEETGPEREAELAELNRQLVSVRQQAEQVTGQSFVCDAVSGEDILVAPGVALIDYLNAPWIAHRIPMLDEDAEASFPELKDDLKNATKFYPRTPAMMQDAHPVPAGGMSAEDADRFVQYSETLTKEGECWNMVWEIWDKTTNHVMVWVEGTNKWARAPYVPQGTTRFYPLFLTVIGHVEGERHPQSLVSRSAKLIDEYNRIGSAEAEHRRRIRPKLMFNKGRITGEDANKLTNGTTAEYVGIEPADPSQPMDQLLYPVIYPQMDPGLYDRSRVMYELERIWGIQEALSAGVTVAKTATEADIQQKGFSARIEDKRDAIEDTLNELAVYTAELALLNLSVEEVEQMVGPDALWPKIETADQLRSLARVMIRAGSSGKPNTEMERQSWSVLLPQLTEGVQMIAQLRGATPSEVADKLEELIRITADRSGEHLDVDSLVPQGTGAPMVPPAAPPGPAGAPPPQGQQPPM